MTRARQQHLAIARVVLWMIAALTFAAVVALLVIVLLDARADDRRQLQNQGALKTLAEQNVELAAQVQQLLIAQQDASEQRAALVRQAIADLQRRTQAQLDAMERRMLSRQLVLLEQIHSLRPGTPLPVLVPVPVRVTPSPTPSPTPQPAPTPHGCEPRGRSGKCK